MEKFICVLLLYATSSVSAVGLEQVRADAQGDLSAPDHSTQHAERSPKLSLPCNDGFEHNLTFPCPIKAQSTASHPDVVKGTVHTHQISESFPLSTTCRGGGVPWWSYPFGTAVNCGGGVSAVQIVPKTTILVDTLHWWDIFPVNPFPLDTWVAGTMLICAASLLFLEVTLGEKILERLRPPKKADHSDMDRSKPDKVVFLILCMCVGFASDMYYGLIVPFFPAEAEQHGIPPSMTGVLIAMHPVGMFISSQVAPLVLRHFDPLTLMRATLASQACCALVMALCNNLEGFVYALIFGTFRMLLGGLGATNQVLAQAVAFRILPENKAPAFMAAMLVVRYLGTLSSPTIGGQLYPLEPGGWPLPFVAGASLFIIIYCLLFFINSRSPGITPRSSSASVVQMLSVKAMWFCGVANLILPFFSSFMMEPLYSPVLSNDPYNMALQYVGMMASVPGLSQIFFVIVVGSWVHRRIGPIAQLGLALTFAFFGALFLGPSPIFVGMPQTVGQFVVALVLIGGALGIAAPLQPIFALRIMYRETGLTKDDLGGAMMSLVVNFLVFPMILAPIIGSALNDVIGLAWLGTIWAFTLFVVAVPMLYLLTPYNQD